MAKPCALARPASSSALKKGALLVAAIVFSVKGQVAHPLRRRSLDDEALDLAGQSVDEGDSEGGIGIDAVHAIDRQVNADQQGAMLATATSEMEEQVGDGCVLDEVSEFKRKLCRLRQRA